MLAGHIASRVRKQRVSWKQGRTLKVQGLRSSDHFLQWDAIS